MDRSVAFDILIAIQPPFAAAIFGTKASLFRILSRSKSIFATTAHASADSSTNIRPKHTVTDVSTILGTPQHSVNANWSSHEIV
ncbi:hypothetical protein AN958_00470 [Leucoagaricus sp. SymC.cos]|nr:hypothetical protein AN958_00470 [Leucoagaricus sp. SymC.cos]